uniref:flavodoxin-dependent (E)-4-hydroxy-3-methylbut-2-enyl-diphosphate synthase n=1 Tax=Streptomyces sp. CHD11 TaxID=2741325 RepID=UPI0027E57403
MTAVALGMPSAATRLAGRRKTRQIQVGSVAVGGDAPVSVQSMTTTRTSDIGATLQQIAELRRGRPRVRAVDDDHADVRHRRDPPADRRADRVRLSDRAGGLSHPGRRGRARDHRAEVADPGDRGHSLPAQVRLRRDRGGLRRGAGEPRATSSSSTTRSGRSPGRPRTTAPRSGS